ncbi:MAG TPA: HAD hydrolase family protein, partial [Mucilaginibacter sp.]|nr:HAD hydrolase family protein [Mucilaginibacter sp.]
PKYIKRLKIQKELHKMLPEFAVNIGGATSIDITRQGIDKAYGIRKLRDILKIDVSHMLFIGDALFEGGNDYPARATGADCIQVRDPEETKRIIATIIACQQ